LLAAYTELHHFLARRLDNPHDAADVEQSSFERVYVQALAASVTSPRALLFGAPLTPTPFSSVKPNRWQQRSN
jgi:DNA-directed RNA polymerase specialized sigma24 family protein